MSSTEVERILADHRRYLTTSRNEGARADFSSADLCRMRFASMKLRRGRFDHARLEAADFTAANLAKANLIGADLDGTDLRAARFLDCARLTAARNWQRAHRDADLRCGAPIPP